QSKYVNAIIQAGKDGKIPNGTLVQFNYGNSVGDMGIYRFEKGVWYKENNRVEGTIYREAGRGEYNSANIEDLIGKINY
ncbi:MAG TPA: hypothetical protein PKV66_05815, partial [Candidatus Pelethenecus sp.]|nr:hypothetical protein [Candidatus Pelethenecus sp.]